MYLLFFFCSWTTSCHNQGLLLALHSQSLLAMFRNHMGMPEIKYGMVRYKAGIFPVYYLQLHAYISLYKWWKCNKELTFLFCLFVFLFYLHIHYSNSFYLWLFKKEQPIEGMGCLSFSLLCDSWVQSQ